LRSRRLKQEYVERLGAEEQTLAELNAEMKPLMDSRKAARTTETSLRIFDRLSKNALQNVMSFFEYKGTDFMKMRSINRKSKSSYM